MLIFYVLAITFTILAITLIGSQLIGNDDLPGWLSKGVGVTLMLFIIFGMFFTMIDFLTLGFLKKKKLNNFYNIYAIMSRTGSNATSIARQYKAKYATVSNL